MPDITITLKDAAAVRLFSDHHGYEQNVSDGNGGQIPNPETRLQFTRALLRQWARDAILSQKRKEAVEQISIIEDGEVA